jgi:hypothetical protein
MSPPILQDIACSGEKDSPHPSQNFGRDIGVRPNLRRILSLNSSAERSVPFSLDGVEESHAPVVDERVMRRWSSGLEVDRMESSCCL